MKKIKNILFDLGGVLFPLSVPATIEALMKAANTTQDQLDKWLKYNDLGYRYETGKCTTKEFMDGLNTVCSSHLDDETFARCWNAMILGYPAEHQRILDALHSKGYNLYILSNINELHVDYVELLAQWPQNLFVKKYYSNEIHFAKPHRECYEYVINDSKIDPAETLYIDDRPDNAAMGREMGFATINMPQNGNLYEELQDLLK
ncbi:MAG: HAD family phosphatase [Bacteroidales bacterium]|nr:HAD family phosphatase [Bacteroidales bacterium]